jgi:hypothetical protein
MFSCQFRWVGIGHALSIRRELDVFDWLVKVEVMEHRASSEVHEESPTICS